MRKYIEFILRSLPLIFSLAVATRPPSPTIDRHCVLLSDWMLAIAEGLQNAPRAVSPFPT